MSNIQTIDNNGETLGIIIRNSHTCEGVDFLTPDAYSQQLAYMHHPKDKLIDAHVHNPVHRSVVYTQEVLVIKKGKLRVDFYDNNRKYLESRLLESGDVILLAAGGHGFKVIEEVDMIEIKQGPYSGDADKQRFVGVEDKSVILKGDE